MTFGGNDEQVQFHCVKGDAVSAASKRIAVYLWPFKLVGESALVVW